MNKLIYPSKNDIKVLSYGFSLPAQTSTVRAQFFNDIIPTLLSTLPDTAQIINIVIPNIDRNNPVQQSQITILYVDNINW